MAAITMGEMVRQAREELGLNESELATRLNISATWLHEFEGGHGDAPPAPQVLNRMAQLLELSIAEMLAAAGYDLSPSAADAATRSRIIREAPPAELFGVRYLIDEASAEILEGVALQMSILGQREEIGIKTIKYSEVQ